MARLGPRAITRVLFVCLGNICRSPLAEAAFRFEADAAGLTIEADSAGTGAWHAGKQPDSRSQAIALAHGVDISGLRARQVCEADFAKFSHIFAMDHDNLDDLNALAPLTSKAQISLLLDHVPGREGEAVGDPYYGGVEGFAESWELVTEAARKITANL